MKKHATTVQELDYSSIRSSVQDTTGEQSKLMLRHTSKSVISANDSVISPGNHQSILPR